MITVTKSTDYDVREDTLRIETVAISRGHIERGPDGDAQPTCYVDATIALVAGGLDRIIIDSVQVYAGGQVGGFPPGCTHARDGSGEVGFRDRFEISADGAFWRLQGASTHGDGSWLSGIPASVSVRLEAEWSAAVAALCAEADAYAADTAARDALAA
ncbi:hypothetical protein [Prosthecomicrobium hirschii]|uniref:hypothetical protein n=1 Tax=Prosthecodimorpha hirschii TaxID=665126 RepID=UPI00221F7903|nr:hypothetical protein [Prosthecomicrobium hirschii]MCW1844152.1 hypothetical protein [Prosthecomicrobium hirschii]